MRININNDLVWKTLSNSDGIGRSFNIPSNTKELNIIVYINANGNYYFYDMHMTNWNAYRPYRFYDGYSKANVLFNNGKLTLSSSYVNDVDFTSTSYLEVKYR